MSDHIALKSSYTAGKAMNEVPITNVAKIPFPGQNNLTGRLS